MPPAWKTLRCSFISVTQLGCECGVGQLGFVSKDSERPTVRLFSLLTRGCLLDQNKQLWLMGRIRNFLMTTVRQLDTNEVAWWQSHCKFRKYKSLNNYAGHKILIGFGNSKFMIKTIAVDNRWLGLRLHRMDLAKICMQSGVRACTDLSDILRAVL